ncbi:GH92 family glycosyl hydrolase [Actinomyces polynesiensis]|uniref:GH92 family glycosyl hydrolase n=1 Tax=Actinomyces polynesiensis TaxID=1325934 RepID=UPI00093A000A|nr:GH92 family glycosyl hydrolase [Actinomyces polynesiensis]
MSLVGHRIGALAAAGALAITGLSVGAALPAQAQEQRPVDQVDTLIGTGRGGDVVGTINEFPGATVPFGMTQFSPDTTSTYWGYSHDNDRSTGFSMTHSSAGCTAFGDIPILPTTTAPGSQPWYAAERIAHDSTEVGRPGYYTVRFPDTGVTAELSATTRTGIGRFTFSKDAPAYIHVRSGGSLNGNSDATATVSADLTTVTGSATTGNFCGKGNSYTIYYAATFSEPAKAAGTWSGDHVNADGVLTGKGGRSGAWLEFTGGHEVDVRIAVSYISVDGALANLRAESTGRSFDQIRSAAESEWDEALGRVEVSGGSADDTKMFYTSLYRALLHPNTFDDADGRYLGFDGKVHQLEPGQAAQYTNVSDWDTYRSLMPLQAMLFPDEASDLAQSLVNDAEQSGSFPRWKIANGTTGQMTGDSVVPLIVNAYVYGGQDFDTASALEYMVSSAMTGGQSSVTPSYLERSGADQYNRLQYGPQTSAFKGDHQIVGASITQEWSIDDFAIGRFAAALGDGATAGTFQTRSTWWRNIFNPAWNTVSPRNADGTFMDVRDALAQGFGQAGFDEGNSEQYLWLEPQDINSLVSAIGGKEAAAQRLDTFFTQTNVGANQPYMWAGNEVNFHIPWIYDYIGQPWRTQQVTDLVRKAHYAPTVNGMPGNDDLGAMSSWYLWTAMGLYPFTPGTTDLAVSTPVFEKVVLRPGAADAITITAPGAATNRYITGLSVNGRVTDRAWVDGADVLSGGTIAYSLAAQPDKSWATGADAAPPSYGEGGSTLLAGADCATLQLAPGGSGTCDIVVRNIGTSSVTLPASSGSSGGLDVSVPGATVAAGGLATVKATVVASAGVAGGSVSLPVALGSQGQETVAYVAVTVDAPTALSRAFTVVATAPEGDRGRTGNFDGSGASYRRDLLEQAGVAPGAEFTIPGTGMTATWPAAEVGQPDAAVPAGQKIAVAGNPTSIAFVGAARNGGQSAQGTVTYSDGSTAPFTLGLDDWVLPTGPNGTPNHGNVQLARISQRNTANGSQNEGAIIWVTPAITAPEGLTITGVVLPQADKQRIFAIASDAPDPTEPTDPTDPTEPGAPVDTSATLSVTPTSVAEGDSASVTATITVAATRAEGDTGAGTPAGTVDLVDGETVLAAGLVLGADGRVSVSLPADLAVGEHSLSAVFTPTDPDAFGPSTSDVVVVTVTAKSDPSDPTTPTDPTDPTDPGQPTDPADPGQPTDPAAPSEPGAVTPSPNASGQGQKDTDDGAALAHTGSLAIVLGGLSAVSLAAGLVTLHGRRRRS